MEVFQNGRFSSGEPVYQIGTKNADGTYDVKVFDLMTKEQAEDSIFFYNFIVSKANDVCKDSADFFFEEHNVSPLCYAKKRKVYT